MGEHVSLDRKNAPAPNKGCKWCGNLEPPLAMYRVNATRVGDWLGPYCNKKCLINHTQNYEWKFLYVHTVWKE